MKHKAKTYEKKTGSASVEVGAPTVRYPAGKGEAKLGTAYKAAIKPNSPAK